MSPVLSRRPPSLLPPLCRDGLTAHPLPREGSGTYTTATEDSASGASPPSRTRSCLISSPSHPRGLHLLNTSSGPPCPHPRLLAADPPNLPNRRKQPQIPDLCRLWPAQSPRSHGGNRRPSWDRGSGTQGSLVYLGRRDISGLGKVSSMRYREWDSLLPVSLGNRNPFPEQE